MGHLHFEVSISFLDSTPSNVTVGLGLPESSELVYTNIAPADSRQSVPLSFTDHTIIEADKRSICIEHGDDYEIQFDKRVKFNTITWYHTPIMANTQSIDISNTAKYKNGTTQFPSLTILNFTHSDIGSYMYYVNYEGNIKPSHNWILKCGPSVEINKDKHYVKTGEDNFTLASFVGGDPKNIDWYFTPNTGTKRKIDPSTDSNYEGATTENPSLTILHISAQDEGEYTCCAQYDNCEEKKSLNENRGYVKRIEITPTKGIAVVGDTSFTFECIIKGVKTVSEANWYKINTNNAAKLIKGDQYESWRKDWNYILTIKSVSKTNAHIYKFKAKVDGDTELELYSELIVNGDESIIYFEAIDEMYAITKQSKTAVGHEIPTVLINESKFQVQTGTNFAIPCQVTAIPAATQIYWEFTPPWKGSHKVDVNADNKYAGSTTETESLTIKGFDAEDIGCYQCFAENAVGTAKSRFVTIIEKEPLCFILFGTIGGGKSSIGNIFLQNEVFPRRRGNIKGSFTKEFKIAEEVVRCKRIDIIDTPGVRNSTERGELEICVKGFREATRCTYHRPNALLLIVSLESPFDESFLCFLNELTEEDFKYVIVIFTTNRKREESREELFEHVNESLRVFLLEKKLESFFVDINYNDSFNLHMQKVIPTIDELVQYCKVTQRQNEHSKRKVIDGFDF
ncbi:unnamed protein product [Mytilus coruscus]|uniref:Ig-like domain-containing protein n=1 Tax=Mytilus coruscus TaxID=42192 RepID=A0A6J8E9G7_MYTCO|nr:unnamed protein product [Mytilus coruscus]